MQKKLKKTNARATRVKNKIVKTTNKPRLHVYRSNKYIYAQVIDQKTGKILASASEKQIKLKKSTKTQRASMVGELVAKNAIKNKTSKVVFDRGARKYHGRVKSLAEAARKAGLIF